MSTRLVNLVADAADPAASAHWWAEALGWAVIFETRHEVAVEPPAGRPGLPWCSSPSPTTSRSPTGSASTWPVLAAPEGSEFCVLSPR